MSKSSLEQTFVWLLKAHNLSLPEREVRLNPERRWRYDFVWKKEKLIIELEGGVWQMAGHQHPLNFIANCEKYNWAVVNGYKLLRYTTANLNDSVKDIKNILKNV